MRFSILPQHKIAVAALLALHNSGSPARFQFDPGSTSFTVNGKKFTEMDIRFDDYLNENDIKLLNKAKVQLDHTPAYFVDGDTVRAGGALECSNLGLPASFAFHNLAAFPSQELALQSLELARRLHAAIFAGDENFDVKIRMVKDHPDAKPPKVAYEGTSAAFDVASIETIEIPAMTDAIVPIGLRFSIDQRDPYYMTVHMRSSFGFKKGIQNHIGIIDSGYTGDFGIKVFNKTALPLTINKGEYFAQILVHKKPRFVFEELTKEEWQAFEEKQLRGPGGFGSSGK